MSALVALRRATAAAAVAAVAAVAGAGAATGTAAAAAPSPPRVQTTAYSPPPHLDQWWYDAMRLAQAQQRTNGGEGVTIAVLDGYLDPSVPDLKGADVTVKPGCNGDETPRDMGQEADHGTAMVTALVGQGTGNGPGGRGVLGVVPNATVNFYSMNEIHDDGEPDCDTFFAGKLILRAVDDGADIITTQVVGGLVGGMDDEIAEAIDRGVAVVSASGSAKATTGQVDAPADVAGVAAIGAVDSSFAPWVDNPASNLNLDFHDIDLSAPGVDLPLGGFIDGRWVSGATRTGTSGAAVIAAGALATVKAMYPEATGNQLLQAAVRTAREDGIAWDEDVAYGAPRIGPMTERDPSGWPDVNPFRMSPEEVESTFSPSDYQDPTEQGGQATAGDEPTDEPTDEQPADASAPAEQEAGAATSGDDAGPPVGALAIGGAIGLAVLAGAVLLARRRSGPGAGRPTS